MYERILVVLDGSDLAEVAVPYAEELSRHLGSQIVLASVLWVAPESALDIMFESGRERPYSDLMETPVGQYLHKVAIQADHVERIVLTGMPDEQILGLADNYRVKLVVLSSHGESGVKRLVFGSVAHEVVRAAKVPVLILKPKSDIPRSRVDPGVRKILVPLDGSQVSEAVLPYVEELALKFGADLTLLSVLAKGYHNITQSGHKWVVYPEQQMESDKASAMIYLNKVADRLTKKGIAFVSEVKFGDPAEQIVNSVVEMGADLVAMSSHGRSGIARWALGSVADKVLRIADAPVLLVKSTLVVQDDTSG